jgi:DNA-directed RNA polymerase specialized sigma24 family protein
MPHHDDLAIVRALDAGDARRFDAFFDEIFPRLHRFVLTRARGDTGIARDVCQQALVRAMDNLGRYRGDTSLYAWICRFAHDALRDLEDEPLAELTLTAAGAEAALMHD